MAMGNKVQVTSPKSSKGGPANEAFAPLISSSRGLEVRDTLHTVRAQGYIPRYLTIDVPLVGWPGPFRRVNREGDGRREKTIIVGKSIMPRSLDQSSSKASVNGGSSFPHAGKSFVWSAAISVAILSRIGVLPSLTPRANGLLLCTHVHYIAFCFMIRVPILSFD